METGEEHMQIDTSWSFEENIFENDYPQHTEELSEDEPLPLKNISSQENSLPSPSIEIASSEPSTLGQINGLISNDTQNILDHELFTQNILNNHEGKTKTKKSRSGEKLNLSNIDPEILSSIMNDLIDDVSIEVAFEIHRKLKLGLLCVNCDSIYFDIVNKPKYDIFGQTAPEIQNKIEPFDCLNCKRTFVPQRYVSHLEKCMGLGRNSSRIANKRIAMVAKNEMEEDKQLSPFLQVIDSKIKPPKKEKSPKISKHHKKSKSKEKIKVPIEIDFDKDIILNADDPVYKANPNLKEILKSKCGVISNSSGKMCNKTFNCPQHTDEMREQLREKYFGKKISMECLKAALKQAKKRAKLVKQSTVTNNPSTSENSNISISPENLQPPPVMSPPPPLENSPFDVNIDGDELHSKFINPPTETFDDSLLTFNSTTHDFF